LELSNGVADVNRRWKDAKRQCQYLVQELTLLQTQGSKLCLAIVDPPTVHGHLLEGMQSATIYHASMAGELAAPGAEVPSTS
jgi:hypothetical protein